MKCPYCNGEMEKGLIHSTQEISWIKGEKRLLFARADMYKDSVILSERSFWKGSACVAYNCQNCQKVIVDYSDESSDLNNR